MGWLWILFSKLRLLQRQAEKETTSTRIIEKVERLRKNFLLDHQSSSSKYQAELFLNDVIDSLDDTIDADHVRIEIQGIRREFKFTENVFDPIENFDSFKVALEKVRYSSRLATQEPDFSKISGNSSSAH